mgnify:CR=1 FL=1
MGREEFVTYDSRGLQPQAVDDGVIAGYRVPEFDLEVSAQDENPYKTMEYNQLALQLFQMGFFRADMADQALRCLELMDFKNKDQLMSSILQGQAAAWSGSRFSRAPPPGRRCGRSAPWTRCAGRPRRR